MTTQLKVWGASSSSGWVELPLRKPARRPDTPPVDLTYFLRIANRLGQHIRGHIETGQIIDGTHVRYWSVYNSETGEVIYREGTRASHYRAITELNQMVGFCRLARWLDIDYRGLNRRKQ